MLTVIPELDLTELIAYGKSKGVEIVLWTVFNVLDSQLEAACKKYADMGIKGFKVDFLCGLMDCMVGSLRGMGYSVIPMFVSLTGACAFRVFWIFTIFAVNRTLEVLYLSYPVSWIITAASHMVTYYIVRKHFPKEDKA